MSRLTRLFDWRFVFSLAFLLLVSYLVYAGVATARDNRDKAERIDTLVAELQRQHGDAEDDRQSAAAERAKLLAGQQALEHQYAVLIRRQAALLTYLREHGIEVPARFITTARAIVPASSSPPRSTSPRRTTAAPPAVTSPGKSGTKGKARAHRPRNR